MFQVESYTITTTNKACQKAMEGEILEFSAAHKCGTKYGPGEKLNDKTIVVI
jgi:hypothetical protein